MLNKIIMERKKLNSKYNINLFKNTEQMLNKKILNS